ncbi:hypothetical protein [Sphingomonas quercus]|uniref:hypothetical protein n=1 Tax=Sphingomonas quercus TaxID=2842451 RepID=UPI00209B0E1F|nr:hypothetical protein [Sphingomonas quercus]
MDIHEDGPVADSALDRLSVAPPPEGEGSAEQGSDDARPAPPKIRTGHDASDIAKLRRDPSSEDGKLDVALDETFPTSDPPSITQPNRNEPAPSSGYDEEAEGERERMKAGE